MDQDEQFPLRAKFFVAGLILLGIGLTGASMVKRVQAIEQYPRAVVSILQQSCDTSAYANPLTNVRGESTKMIDRPC
tara:strand:+ start:9366 stop:9596 length:231 start_codon:yes stop_codon:yes gene_type:complete